VFLAMHRLRDASTRREAWSGLAIVAGASLGLFAVLAVALQGVFLPTTLLETARDVVGGVARTEIDGRPWWSHRVDQLNGQALSGPLSAGFFVVLATAALLQWRRLGTRHHALLLCGGAMLAISLIAGDSNLGYARNWDLLAPWAMVMAACGLALLPALVPDGATLRRVLVVLTLASAVHTMGWVAVNASQAASIARFTTLPLGMGRVESTLGYNHLLRGDPANAERWLSRSLTANPANLRAHLHFGILFMEQKRYDLAVEAWRSVVALRPASAEYGLDLAEALLLSGDLPAAAAELKRVLKLDPRSARARLRYATVLIDLGRVGEARDVLGGALQAVSENAECKAARSDE
jgi:Tfp pilus assembly protein PilF